MKTFFYSLIPMFLVGLGVFALAKSVRFQPWTKTGQEEAYKEYRKLIAVPTADPNAESLPQVVCKETEFNFGVMPPFDNGTHVFRIQNTGSGRLILKNGGTSCSCTETDLAAVAVEPGDSHDITVTWNTDKAGEFAQYTKIITNSPDMVELELWVKGHVSTILDASVASFGFGELASKEVRKQDFYIFSGIWDSIEIDRIETTSDDIQCVRVESPQSTESQQETVKRIVSRPDKPVQEKSRLDLRVTVTAQAEPGLRSEMVRIYVRPPALATEDEPDAPTSGKVASDLSLKAMYSKLQSDGTITIELPVETLVRRRFSLYGPVITNADKRLIDLGKLRTTSPAREWSIVAKVRGDQMPTDVKVALTGIDGVSATVQKIEGTADQIGNSYRIKIRAEEKLRLGAYNGEHAGKLTIESPGIQGEELLEFNVELDVLEEN